MSGAMAADARPILEGLRDRSILDIPIVDAHHHLWDLKAGHYPTKQDQYDTKFFLGDYRKICRDYLATDYAADLAGFDIRGTVHIQAARAQNEQVQETQWLHEVHARFGLPSAVVGHVIFIQPDCAEVLEGHARFPLMRGIRSRPVTSPGPGQSAAGQLGTMQDHRWLRNFALLEKHGMSWDMRIPYWHLAEGAEVARAFPGIPMVVNHTGLPLDRSEEGLAIWRRGLEALADCPNVVIKISELGLPHGKWDIPSNARVVREAAAIFGPDRIIFASNLPVASLSTDFGGIVSVMLEGLKDAPRETLEKFFHRNAARFYRIALDV
ncbi:amidohydrolase family protein [Sabulicella glaciei]|uniref:Amidohydrolase family protein n=1 Tax=Sabulicella glaciei TaxID=2984948 RepID=A0ABT3NTI5_9PROT|nr:amidohydrolase family protein [Roseococcus sp. MDT2-1-1]MCW8085459.1 amidohydrolase family protein [Roseococcus sp. MDT2-1-1]